MPRDHEVRRYAAYFPGWAQAFGEHEVAPESRDETTSWLFGQDRVGLILPPNLAKRLFREVLGIHRGPPTLTISQSDLCVGKISLALSEISSEKALNAVIRLLETQQDVHLFLSYHFMYPSGTRIITLSHKKPLPLIYKEIGPMNIKLT